VYNLWKSYDVEKIVSAEGGTAQPFLDLLGALTNNEMDYALLFFETIKATPCLCDSAIPEVMTRYEP